MNDTSILQYVVSIHNQIAQAVANGLEFKNADNVVLMGSALSDLRLLAKELNTAVEKAAAEKAE